jgi:hypothetical protein
MIQPTSPDSGPSASGPSASDRSASDPSDADALISRLRVIESQPLADRAAAFGQLYDTLQSILGGASGGGSDGDASGR